MSAAPSDTDIEHSHDPQDIAARLKKGPQNSYLRDWVLGGIDGAVTTFAVVAGVAGAELSTTIILILGVANLVADGFSMAAGNYSGVKAERDDYQRLRETEQRHITLSPEGEREEIRQIFAAKGFEGDHLDTAVDIITAHQERWIEVMVEEEYGAAKTNRSPMKAGAATFAAFLICGAVPLLPFVFGAGANALLSASIMTGFVFFGIGAMKSKWSTSPWWSSALETFLIGMTAAGFAFIVGALLKSWVGV
ncbi:VIT1/CCC1 transporter family protein [Hyphococcus sp.]|uniref:VIT1/CCC1 transporter family protein n=1 Tax=Hyphococcus sp. TaxID=2038636 RepID=UPI0035C78B2E